MLYKSIKLKIVKIVFTSLILHSTNLLADNEDVIDNSALSETFEKLIKNSSSKISQQDGWSIVSLIENGNHVFWFFAPKENAAHPAVAKKTVSVKDGSSETVILTLCEAPKQKCEDLIRQFKTINELYK